jgi:carboxypeptidase Taq
MPVDEKLTSLKIAVNEISDLVSAMSLLGWDQQTYMPKGGAEDRGYALSTLARITHLKTTAPEIGALLEDLMADHSDLDPDSNDARLIQVSWREYTKRARIPTRWVVENARVTTTAQTIWEKAKEESNYSIFQPHLERVMELRREYASFFAPYDHIYDPLLDDFEPGLKTSAVKEIFSTLRPEQVNLIKAISEKPAIDDSFLRLPYAEQGQWDFGVDVITRFGYDWNHGRQDRAVHPFTQGFGVGDVRITTRFDPERGASALFSTMHEAGHALYDLGFDHALARTPLASGASMALHESQSRMWENLVGRSLPFWKFFYPRLQVRFPSQLGNVDLMTFYRGINKVEPSYIRVEADEATYNLHCMLRLELEIALMDTTLEVRHLPEAWNSRMKDYLGVTPPNDRLGVLQDVHWSNGLIGYFPTYALGNLVSVQLWEKIQQDIPDLLEQFEQGQFSSLLAWLRLNVHRHGAKFEPQELIEKVTGNPINPAPYLHYLKSKYSEIYGL